MDAFVHVIEKVGPTIIAMAAIMQLIAAHNENPKPLVWTAQADQILAKVGRAKAALIKAQQRLSDH